MLQQQSARPVSWFQTWPGAITCAAFAIGTQVAEFLLTGECLFRAGA